MQHPEYISQATEERLEELIIAINDELRSRQVRGLHCTGCNRTIKSELDAESQCWRLEGAPVNVRAGFGSRHYGTTIKGYLCDNCVDDHLVKIAVVVADDDDD